MNGNIIIRVIALKNLIRMAVNRCILMVIQEHVLQYMQRVWVESRVLAAAVFKSSLCVIEVELCVCWRSVHSRNKGATTMVQFSLNSKHWRPSTAFVHRVIFHNLQRSERESTVIFPNVLSKVFSLSIIAFEKCF